MRERDIEKGERERERKRKIERKILKKGEKGRK